LTGKKIKQSFLEAPNRPVENYDRNLAKGSGTKIIIEEQ